MKFNDEYFMQLALLEARKAESLDEVPIGAIIVVDNKVIARGFNKRETSHDPTGHAEIIAIRKAAKRMNNWRLVDATIYVTLEPCAMCAGAILNSRIKRIVYGACDPKGGALVSSFNLFEQPNLNHHPSITGGILADECATMLTDYFRKKR